MSKFAFRAMSLLKPQLDIYCKIVHQRYNAGMITPFIEYGNSVGDCLYFGFKNDCILVLKMIIIFEYGHLMDVYQCF